MKSIPVVLLLGWILVGSCTRHSADGPLSFWCSNNAGEIAFAAEMTRQWQGQHPEHRLRFQPIPEGQSSEEIILASVVGKTTPDIYANMWQGSVEMYAKAGVLVPLDTLDGFLDFLYARCDSAVVREITSSDGHIYQMPWKVNPIMTLCNTRAMTSLAGPAPPFTYSEFLEAGMRFKADRNGDGYTDRWLGYTEIKPIWYQRLFNFYPLYLAASNGAPLVVDNRAAFNTESTVRVFRFLQELYKHDYFSKERLSASRDPFLDGRIATQFSGPWQISYLEKFKSADLEYAFWPMPVPDSHQGPVYTYGDPKNIVIFNTCRQPQVAWNFIRTMVEQAGDRRLLELTGQLPRRKNLEDDPFFRPFFADNPRMLPFARQLPYIKGVDNCEAIVEVFDIISQEYEACVVYNRKAPEAAVRDAAKAVDVLLSH